MFQFHLLTNLKIILKLLKHYIIFQIITNMIMIFLSIIVTKITIKKYKIRKFKIKNYNKID